MSDLIIRRVEEQDLPTVFHLVEQLLRELGEEGEELGELRTEAVLSQWRSLGDGTVALLAETPDGEAVGVVTLVETFAIYANGRYGIINEMYVAPSHRSTGVGARLIAEALALGRARGWSRVDVTAPESARWARTRSFYDNQGFAFTGPKLKILLG
jgi:GNAT superfamily N-acetyltransferase